jgi:hypothetical protein
LKSRGKKKKEKEYEKGNQGKSVIKTVAERDLGSSFRDDSGTRAYALGRRELFVQQYLSQPKGEQSWAASAVNA